MLSTIEDLRSISLFAHCTEPELEALGQITYTRRYASHVTIFVQGDASPGLWLIRAGRVRLYRVAPSGREFTLCIAQPGKLPCIGMCPLFDGDVSPANAEALEESELLFIDRERALKLAADSAALAQAFALVLSGYVRHLRLVTSTLALHCSLPRLADWLLTYAEQHGRPTAAGIELELDLSREQLSSLFGISARTVQRDLEKLVRAGILRTDRKHIIIVDSEALSRLLE